MPKIHKKKLRPIWADNLTHISGRSRYRKQTARVPLPKGTPHHEAEVNCFATKAQSKNGCQYMKHLIRGIHIIPYTTMYIHIYIHGYIHQSLFVSGSLCWMAGKLFSIRINRRHGKVAKTNTTWINTKNGKVANKNTWITQTKSEMFFIITIRCLKKKHTSQSNQEKTTMFPFFLCVNKTRKNQLFANCGVRSHVDPSQNQPTNTTIQSQ